MHENDLAVTEILKTNKSSKAKGKLDLPPNGKVKASTKNIVVRKPKTKIVSDESETDFPKEKLDLPPSGKVEASTKKRVVRKTKAKIVSDESDTDIPEEKAIKPVDPRNKLNDLNGTEWLPETKSFWFQKGLGSKHPHAQIERLHPAPFSFKDVMRLVKFFTKSGDTVLDPFSGIGSTMKVCALTGRSGVGIELTESWNELAKKRLLTEVGDDALDNINFLLGDCRTELGNLEDNSLDFMVTSPPYWSILNKKIDHKTKVRIEEELETSYSEDERDLGNIEDYRDFLDELKTIFLDCGRKLKNHKYMSIIVSDFRHQSKFYSFHSDIIQLLDDQLTNNGKKLTLQGVKVLAQNHKSLMPYGYPYAYVENVHHQYILIFRKDK